MWCHGYKMDSDVYFEMQLDQVKDEEAKKYIIEGRVAVKELAGWIDLKQGWTYQKTSHGSRIYFRDA